MVTVSMRTNVIVEMVVAGIIILSPFLMDLLRSQGKACRSATSVMLVISAVVFMFAVLMCDALTGISASWIFTLVAWAIGFGVCVAVRLRYRSILAEIVAFLITAFMLMMHFVDVLPVKPYKRFFAAIQPGMMEEEVMTLLHLEFPESGRFPVPVRYDFRVGEIDFALDPKESMWNAEGITVYFQNGLVIRKEYMPD